MSAADTRVIVVHNPPRRRRWSKDKPPLMRIVLLGSSVSENSLVGNLILGRAAFDSEAPPDVVERVAGRLKDRRVIIINSPQLLQTNISDHQITQTVRECVFLSDPGPHVFIIILQYKDFSEEDRYRVEYVLETFSEEAIKHTIVLTTDEETDEGASGKVNEFIQRLTAECAGGHVQFNNETEEWCSIISQRLEKILGENHGEFLTCELFYDAEETLLDEDQSRSFASLRTKEADSDGGVSAARQQKLNLVLCGSDETLKKSISQLLKQKRRDGDLHDRLINLLELPALIGLSEEEVMRQTLRCVSLCHPGVHAFLLIIPDAPLNNEDKAEMEQIHRIFSSRINKHIMILIKQSSEHQTEELNEETQSVIERFGGRHQFFGPKTQVSTLMENIEQMLQENRGECFSTEMFLETQMKKLMKCEEMKKKIHSVETHLLSQGSTEKEDDLRIVLLGKTGVGKSATGNTILGREAFTAEESFESVTKESQRETSEINSRRVSVIDTPGLFDTELSNEEIQREIRHCISMILPGPHVFLLLIPLGRFTKEEETSVKIIQETFGEHSLMYTMVLFTRGDFLKKKTIDQCLGKPGSPLMNLIEACGNRYHVFNNNQTEDRTQVSDLLQKIDDMLKTNGGSYYSCKMFREMEREKQEQQMKILMDRVRETEEEMKKLEEEKERMKMMMEEERQNQNKERKRREEEQKREIREQEKHQKEMRREREMLKEEMRQEKETFNKEKENLQKEIDRLMNRIENERQNHETERKRREEEFKEREERYKTLMKEKEKEREMCEEMKREREEWEKQKLEEKMRREEEDEKRREKEQRDCDEFNQRLKEERERMEREKEELQSKHEEEENKMKILMEKLNREREEEMKKHEEEKERMKMMMDEERQNQDKERKRREEEFNEREERHKREMKEQEQIRDEMKREREMLKDEMRQEKETVKKEKENLQTEIDRLMNRIENERQHHDKERERREEEFNEREERYKTLMKEKEREMCEEMKREREEWEKQKLEEEMRREEEFNNIEGSYKTQIQEKEREIRDEIKREREEWEKQEKIKREKEDEKTREKEKQICDEQIQRLKSEMEGIIREKERIERERQEQLEDSEKRLREERKMREDQQKTLEEKLRLLEEQHEEELKRRRVECREEYEREEYEREKEEICSETDPSLQVSLRRNMERTGSLSLSHLFHRLHLEDRHRNRLRAADVLQITAHSLQYHESCAEEELIQTYIQKLLMMNYRARYIKTKETSERHHTQQGDSDLFEYEFNIFERMSLSNKETSQSDLIHPMDVQMAVFHCADGLLKQLMVTKLSQCQYALPLLVPDPFTQQTEFPLWTFRQITKSWKIRNTDNEIISQTQPIYKAETPMVFFFRFGSVSASKSQLMNRLINEKHNTFFHRNCPCSSRTRVLMDGVVEIAWFCPSGANDNKFTDCVAFCNLHGDAGDHEKQLQILTEMSSVNVVLLPRLHRNDRSMIKVQELYKDSKPLICLFTENASTLIETRKGKYKIGLKDRNQSDVSEELRRAINYCHSQSSSTFRLEDVSKHSEIRVDEEDDDDCRRGREAAQQMMSLLKKKDLTDIKDSFLPHQGKLWHQWSQKNKELHRPRGDEMEMDISRKQAEMKKIRQQQHDSDISVFMKLFIKEMNSHAAIEKMFFLKWLTVLLDDYTSADLSALHHKYNEKWSAVLKLKEKHDKSEQLKSEQAELERISEELQAAGFGLEHIMREIGQIYESCSSVRKNKKDLQVHFSSLPSLAAEMMISGSPLELMDGDAAHVPVIWISAVLDQLIQKLGDRRVFVLSVLGVQSSGKSTVLNAMFGLQSAVSAGRYTRGAFMQLVRVSDEMKTQMNIDYILVVDTEGLNALELAGSSKRHHDNELATFVVGLGNLTLINIFGENPAEMQDILQIVVQAFMRMNKVRLSPSCVFVHQNVSDVTAGERNMEGRRRLQETLDEMTKLAAKEEDCDVERFSDVIRFDVQKDVKYFAQLWEGNPLMAPPNPNYCENIQELKKTIMSHASRSHGMMLKNFKDRINDLWEALLNERFVFSFRNSLEISVYRKLETKYRKWSWSLRRAMMETENKLQKQIENEVINEVNETDLHRELKKTSEEMKKSMSDFFEKDTDAEILIHWKTSFEIKIKELQENIVRETKRKLNEILQQRDLKKKIDAQRTLHENTLYEKSKELALKLRDKTNDEETLKTEFYLFWEQSVKKIIRDTPAIRDIDILRDMRRILSDVYESVSVDLWRKRRDIFTVQSYSDYVQIKKSRDFLEKAKRFVKEMWDYSLSREDEAQIRSFITDVSQQTDKMIQSFNISKMGYNISCIQQLIDYIKARVTEHEAGSVRYVFKNEFFMDLVLSICERANKMITDQHRLFREDNDPVLYLEKKKKEYYSIFLKYCHGAT